MNKKLLRTSVIASVMAMAFTASAFAYNYDYDGYGAAEVNSTGKNTLTGVMWDAGWYAPDGKFYTYVQTDGTINTANVLSYDRKPNSGEAIGLTTAQLNKLKALGLDHNSQADSVWDHDAVPSYTQYFADNGGVTAKNVAQLLADNLKFNADLNYTLIEWEEAARKEHDKDLDTRIKKIQLVDNGNNSFTFTNGAGEKETISFADTDTNTRLVNSDTGLGFTSDGKLRLVVVDEAGRKVTGLADIGKYVKENAGNAIYSGNTTINEQIAENTSVINRHSQQISQNTTNITNNKNEIDNIKKKYVQQITENNAGDAWTVTQTDGGTITIKDTYVTDVTHELDANGNLVTTVYQNQGEDPIIASVKIGDANISYNDYQNSNEQNEYAVTKLTIEQAINQNATYIDNINDNNVTNVTKQVTNDDKDIWNVTQTVNGQTSTVQITDEHINSYSMSVVGDSIESKITTNFGGNFEQSVRVGNATIRYEGDTGTQNVSTIEQAINNNYTKIENVENNYVTNISKRQDGTEVINNKTYNVEYYQVTQNVTDANGNTTVETVNIKDTTLVEKNLFGQDAQGNKVRAIDIIVPRILTPDAQGNYDAQEVATLQGMVNENALVGYIDQATGVPEIVMEFEDTSGNVVQGAVDFGTLFAESLQTEAGANIVVTQKARGLGNYAIALANHMNNQTSITFENGIVIGDTTGNNGNVNGLYMNNLKITGVADGEISANSTEAINGSQLWETNRNMDKLGGRLDKVGAGAAALAALHPLDFDPDDKLQFSAGVGNYKGETAAALGAFYRPTEKVMFSVAGTMGNGENMVNAGVTFALDRKNNVSNSRVAMAHEIQDLRDQVAALTALVSQIAGKGNPLLDTVMFPDVPKNHWAYDYVENLQKRGIIEGYPDGNFGGDRSMTRYEYAAMLYRALEKGFPVDGRLLKEFEAELGRIRIDRIKGADDDANKVERVRVNDYEDRDDYGSKLAQVVANAAPAIEEEPAA